MKSRLFYRIVGIIAIIGALIVFLPNLSKKKYQNEQSDHFIYLNSEEENITNQENFTSIEDLLNKKNEELKQSQETGQYVIQLAVLKNSKEIEKYVALLRLHNYTVYTEPVKIIEGQAIKLFVGPYFSKKESYEAMISLQELTGLSGQSYKVKN